MPGFLTRVTGTARARTARRCPLRTHALWCASMMSLRARFLAAVFLIGAAVPVAGAAVSFSAGAAGLRFHDGRLRELYPHPLAVRARAAQIVNGFPC